MKCIVFKPSHIQLFLCNFKIERDISISFGKKWSWPPCSKTKEFILKALVTKIYNLPRSHSITAFCFLEGSSGSDVGDMMLLLGLLERLFEDFSCWVAMPT